jgi:hypothetical protein
MAVMLPTGQRRDNLAFRRSICTAKSTRNLRTPASVAAAAAVCDNICRDSREIDGVRPSSDAARVCYRHVRNDAFGDLRHSLGWVQFGLVHQA